jgi:hypothetical protein
MMVDKQPRKDMPQQWWPYCPYSSKVFPMTGEQYVKAVPDPHMRTAISGYLMREGWCVFEKQLTDAIENYPEEIIEWLKEKVNDAD